MASGKSIHAKTASSMRKIVRLERSTRKGTLHPPRGTEPVRRWRSGAESALFGGDGEEGGGLLAGVLTLAVRAFDFGLVVLLEGKDHFERLFAVLAIILVTGHGSLRRSMWEGDKEGCTPRCEACQE
jgi:hypothetical protein